MFFASTSPSAPFDTLQQAWLSAHCSIGSLRSCFFCHTDCTDFTDLSPSAMLLRSEGVVIPPGLTEKKDALQSSLSFFSFHIKSLYSLFFSVRLYTVFAIATLYVRYRYAIASYTWCPVGTSLGLLLDCRTLAVPLPKRCLMFDVWCKCFSVTPPYPFSAHKWFKVHD